MTSAPEGSLRIASQRGLGSCYTDAVLAVVILIARLSFGSVIFSGDLGYGVADGIGLALFTAAVFGMLVSFSSSYPGSLAIPQDRTAPILAPMAVQVAAALPAGTSAPDRLINILAAIALTSFFTGVVLCFLGRFRLGNHALEWWETTTLAEHRFSARAEPGVFANNLCNIGQKS